MANYQSPWEMLMEAAQLYREEQRVYYALPFWKRWRTQPPAMSATQIW